MNYKLAKNRICGIMASLLASSELDHGLERRSGQLASSEVDHGLEHRSGQLASSEIDQ
jgi:hypothetical protein